MELEPRRGVSRETVIAALRAEGIPVNALNPPIYRLPAFWDGETYPSGVDVDRLAEACPHSERLGAWGVMFPHWMLLGDHDDIRDIADGLAKVLGTLRA